MRRKPSRASRRLTLLAVAVALGGGLAFHRYAAALADAPRGLGPATTVLAAARTLPRGTVLDPADLSPVAVPAAAVPPGAIAEASRASGRVLLAPLAEGEPLTETRLGLRGAGPVAALVPAGFRAVAVPSSLPAAAVTAGDVVDVLATYPGPRAHAETVLTAAEVLLVMQDHAAPPAGGPALGSTDRAAPTLLLLVTPEDAERLAYARAFATLTVAVGGLG